MDKADEYVTVYKNHLFEDFLNKKSSIDGVIGKGDYVFLTYNAMERCLYFDHRAWWYAKAKVKVSDFCVCDPPGALIAEMLCNVGTHYEPLTRVKSLKEIIE